MISGIKSKISFEVGHNPRTAPRPANFRDYIPLDYDAVLIISADFELAWAWRYAKSLKNTDKEAERYARRTRQNIPLILELCEQYDIPITWATVGHLFLDRCEKEENGLVHPEISRLAHFENEWWKYAGGDWFEHDPCTSVEEDNAWYAPDLVQMIIDSPAGHEIGCHTFSHIDCRDGICPPAVLREELTACQRAASRFGVQLESFVFPGNFTGNFQVLREAGYSSVRINKRNEIGYPSVGQFGLWHLPATVEVFMNPAWSKHYNLYRFQKIIDRTVKARAMANFWFHPSLLCETTRPLFEGIFTHLQRYQERLWVTTMKDYAHWLNNR